jgi:hypothetical protein
LRRPGYLASDVPNLISAREAATPSTPCGCIQQFQSNARNRETAKSYRQKSSRYSKQDIGDRSKPVSGILGKPFTAETCGAPAADEAHQDHPNALAVSLERPNKPKPGEVPSTAERNPSDASPPLNKPPRATPCTRTDRYRLDSPSAPPSPDPNPNSAPPAGDANPGRHHTSYVVCQGPIGEAAKARHTTSNAPSRPSSHPSD